MAKADNIEIEGTIIDALPGTQFKVKLENGFVIMAQLSGKLRLNNIRVAIGDKVKTEVSPYDLSRGRITWRIG